jgi:hypothetical protein
VFTVIASLIFHNFWAVPEAQKMVPEPDVHEEPVGLPAVFWCWPRSVPGGWSLDARRRVGGLATA